MSPPPLRGSCRVCWWRQGELSDTLGSWSLLTVTSSVGADFRPYPLGVLIENVAKMGPASKLLPLLASL